MRVTGDGELVPLIGYPITRPGTSRESSRVTLRGVYIVVPWPYGGTVKDKERIYCSQNRKFRLKTNFLKVGSLFVLDLGKDFYLLIFF